MSAWRFLLAALLATLLAACLPGRGRNDQAQLMVAPGETLLQLTVPGHGARSLMKRVGVNGTVETWMSQDRFSISLDRGVLVATRGFGFDMMGGDAGATLAALASPGEGVYSRRMRYLTSDNHSTWIQAGCTMRLAKAEAGDRHYREECQARQSRFTNHYWLDGNGRILRSTQWASFGTGLLEITFTRQ